MSDSANNPRQLVVFTLGTEQYALPIQQVHEIIRYSEPRSVASRADWVRGVISLRGRIVPVYDLAARLGLPSELTEHTKIVIVEAGNETAGVIVDGVEEVLTVEDGQLQEAPGADTTLIESIAKIADRLVVLLKPSAIFTASDLALAA
jgi:purine-binding chemotaxis protein CheW